VLRISFGFPSDFEFRISGFPALHHEDQDRMSELDAWNPSVFGPSRTLTRGQAVIEYFVAGSGPTVVLLPALAGTIFEFAPLATTLVQAGYRVVGMHFPGIGHSTRPMRPPATLQEYAVHVRTVLDALSPPVTEPVVLLGRALGNRIARVFAVDYPSRTAGVVLLAAGGKRRGRGGLATLGRYLMLHWPWLSLERRRKLQESLICVRRNVIPLELCRKPPVRAFLQQSRAARRSDWNPWRGGGRAPMLVLQGEEDQVAEPRLARELQADFPDRVELHLLPESGHGLMYDAPAAVIERTLAFLARLRAEQSWGETARPTP
jgi:pimeloyl-ACP methyl ester carboxylesterase